MSFETECFSMNSDMSKRTRAFSVPNMNCARVRATSVLPTPVGPRNRNEPIGRFGLFNPARERRIARASALIDLSWEMMRLCSSSSIRRSFWVSSSFIEMILFAQGAQVLALLAFFVRVETRLLELVVRDGVLHAVHDELDALLDFGDFIGL